MGVFGITFYAILYIAGQNDVIANTFHWSLQSVTWVLRALIIFGPFIAYYITKRWALGLRHKDEERLHHGEETGIIRRLPSGEYIEVHEPLPAQRAAILSMQLGHDLPGHGELPSGNGHGHGNGQGPELARPVGALARAREALEGFFFERHEAQSGTDDEPKTLNR